MSLIKSIASITLPLGIFFSNNVLALVAPPTKVQCDSCITDIQFTNQVRQYSVLNHDKYVSVLNFDTLDYRKYKVKKLSRVECETEGEPDGRGGTYKYCRNVESHSIESVSNTASDNLVFEDMRQGVQEIKDFNDSVSDITVPEESMKSGWEIVGIPAKEQNLIFLLNQNGGSQFAAKSRSYFDVILRTGGVLHDVPRIQFNLSDGSKLFISPDFRTTDNKIVYKATNLIDFDGNRIDLTKDTRAQLMNVGFNFSNNVAFQAFKRTIQMKGFVVGSKIPKKITTTIIVVSCSSGAGNPCRSVD
ncbi:hypothetical protein CJF42_25825 [Pseudoalteromonas sp. NBT06-2]|uniref:hypothetical protein n=1 Tax=Pseudoalteromonas sp. NBT06-2 TaxID=2025950 RepID=UPI000BA5A36E|nr:hypothetical protein [Pseudoalteromonas sp. NBT06-2]PAJ71503.1 hypothetical protein CJF42_25825 [Pseudoalteromonas sp. NBT06-2]